MTEYHYLDHVILGTHQFLIWTVHEFSYDCDIIFTFLYSQMIFSLITIFTYMILCLALHCLYPNEVVTELLANEMYLPCLQPDGVYEEGGGKSSSHVYGLQSVFPHYM